jgi:uncharacterized protein YndB with AHSA1/START domain
MTTRTVVHDTFAIERRYAASPARVFAAFADSSVKMQWFGEGGVEANKPDIFEFRVGGRESHRGDVGDDLTYTYDALYHDIIDSERIVYAYEMTINSKRVSVSVATIELLADGSGTHLILTEQGAFLDGLDNNAQRQHGTEELLDALGRYLAEGEAS